MNEETMNAPLAQETEPAQEEMLNEAPQTAEGQAGGADEISERRAQAYAVIEEHVRTLHEDGWTIEQLQAFAADEEARADILDGKTPRQAATAYLMRMGGQKEFPMLRLGTSSIGLDGGRVAQMNEHEFARFSQEAYERLMAGEKIRL